MLATSLIIVTSVYFLMNIGLILIWLSSKPYKIQAGDKEPLAISVIIPVRNEAANIIRLLQNLEIQSYPFDKFEVIVADDDSTDGTLTLVKDFQRQTSMRLLINQLPAKINNTSPKKRAIDASIQLAKGELIVTTDGDCRVGKNWLAVIASFQAETGAYLVSSPVTFINDSNSFLAKLWQQMQTIEFSSLIGSGACAMLIGKPNMCNGANLAYLKSVFREVGGFSGNENLASGDDEFLMHKVAAAYPGKVRFLKHQEAIVETQAHQSLQSFYYQRKRWASKWRHYNNPVTTALAVFIFLSNFSIILTAALYFLQVISAEKAVIILFTKFSAELLFLILILSFLNKKRLIWLIPVIQLIYPFYVSFFGLIAQGKNEYIWKGRKLQ
ncbi:glycosyltransferase [Emticicia fluvialis]|uniref:glycosyltransferase n=1 Tax=Emticicia fluvialis TaxID=2974474 RepID=UPI002166318C|nr:glycosyltransferase [Emticicia fluvialis]